MSTWIRASVVCACLLAAGDGASGDVDRTAMNERYVDFQRQQNPKWASLRTVNSLLSQTTALLDRTVRYQIRLTTGAINPVNTPVFGSDLAGRQQQLDTQIGITASHATSTGRDVVVAVLDSGFNLNHPWIASRVLPYGYDPVGMDWDPQDRGNGIDDDHDGIPDAGVGHGTFVAGMVVSVAPDAWIVPVRIADDEGYGLESELVSGIDFAIAMHVDVINLSFEAGTLSLTVCNKLHEAHDAGITVVVSAGNDGSDTMKTMAEDGTTIAVGAVDDFDRVPSWSNTPSDGRGLSLFAPGVNLYGPHGGPSDTACCTWSGTSFAAPLATGAVALALQLVPTATPLQLRNRVRAGSIAPVTTSSGAAYPYAGRLDLRKVVCP
jgi:subtilisin family serine protease